MAYEGVEVQFQSVLTSTVGVDKLVASCKPFSPKEISSTFHYVGGWIGSKDDIGHME
jgi:hypothetical protein